MKKSDSSRNGFLVAIDGPSGAGKSTVSHLLAEALGGILLDTGAMYRAVAYHALLQAATTDEQFGSIARALKFDVNLSSQAILVNGQDLGATLRTPAVSDMASYVSKFRKVRGVLTQRQRALGKRISKRRPVVVEGRDIGTVVFPNVEFKFYVTADPRVRAERRHAQLKKQGAKSTLKSVLKQNEERDHQDSTRAIAPLRCPEDAVIVDTSKMGIAQVVKFMENHIQAHLSLAKVRRG